MLKMWQTGSLFELGVHCYIELVFEKEEQIFGVIVFIWGDFILLHTSNFQEMIRYISIAMPKIIKTDRYVY